MLLLLCGASDFSIFIKDRLRVTKLCLVTRYKSVNKLLDSVYSNKTKKKNAQENRSFRNICPELSGFPGVVLIFV